MPSARASSSSRRTPRRHPITPEDLSDFRLVGAPQISPDGARIVFVHKQTRGPDEYAANLWMVGTGKSADARPFTAGGRDGHPRWSPDGDRVAFIGARTKRKPQVFLIPADGGEARALTSFPEGTIRDFAWSPDGKRLAVAFREQGAERTTESEAARKRDGGSEPPWVIDDWWYRLDGDGYFGEQRFKLYIVDVASGEHRVVYDKDRLGGFTYDFSPDGRRIAITTNRHKKAMIAAEHDEIRILDVASGKSRAVPGLPRGPKTRVRWSPDGKLLAYGGRIGLDDVYSVENLELFVCDPARGKPRSLTAGTDFCLMAPALTDTAEVSFAANFVWAPDSKRLLVKIGAEGESHVAEATVRTGGLRFLTSGTYDHDLGNISADGRYVALTRGSATRLNEVAVGSRRGRTLAVRMCTTLNKEFLGTRAVAPIESHWIDTPDGTRVQVWAMFPPGHTAGTRKRYPAVLEIHGGPHGQYGVGFFHEFQVLAAQGYAVFFSNPRGSKGYGRDHCAAIRGHWGTADWTDIQAVTAFMKEHRHVDARRMGVMGGSYGGYMTNWIIGHTNDFAAAITDRCVSNVVSMGGTSDYVDAPGRYFPGNFWDDIEARWEQSPMKWIGRAKTPTLIIHSEGDLRCNIEQAEQLFVALKLRNVPTRFVRYPRSTSHGLSRSGPPDLRLHRLHQILDWWQRWLAK